MWKNPFWKISFLQGFITRRGFNFPAEIKHITNFKPLLFCCVPCKFPFHRDLRDLKFLWDSSSGGSQVLPWDTTFWLRACSRKKWEFCEIKINKIKNQPWNHRVFAHPEKNGFFSWKNKKDSQKLFFSEVKKRFSIKSYGSFRQNGVYATATV